MIGLIITCSPIHTSFYFRALSVLLKVDILPHVLLHRKRLDFQKHNLAFISPYTESQ